MRKFLIGLASMATATVATQAAAQTGSLNFTIVGDTLGQPFTITNNSTGGLFVVGFGITLVSPFGFDTVANSAGGTFGFDAATAFTPDAASGLATGFSGPVTVPEGSNSLAFTFSDFTPGESFSWVIDVDRPTVATVIGNELIGSTGYADFSNGLRGTGTFVALGTNGSQFQIDAFVPTPSVPEPATWAMLVGGFGLAGAAMRRRATRTRVAFA